MISTRTMARLTTNSQPKMIENGRIEWNLNNEVRSSVIEDLEFGVEVQ